MYKHRQHVYLAGAMEGLTYEQMTEWRKKATHELALKGIDVLDPTRRISYHDQKDSTYAAARVVKHDLQDIHNSSVILVDLRDSTPGRKWGTVCEIAHSHTKNKVIIVVTDEGQFKHPFIEFYATEVHHSLEDAVEAVSTYFI
jgi:nucleoside 2-deoxyribosyltransferase